MEGFRGQFRHAAGFALATVLRGVPKKQRFGAAVRAARWLEPLIAQTVVYEQRRAMPFDGLREVSLDLLLTILTRYGATFDPILQLEGSEHFPRLGDPTLLVGAHAMLSTIFLRSLDDAGLDPVIFGADDRMRICGTTKKVRVIRPSSRLLLEARTHLRKGHLVGTMIDRAESEPRSQSFAGRNGLLRISSALVRVAIHCNARIVFIAARLGTGSEIIITLDEPLHSAGADEVLASFAGFLDRATKEQGGRRDRASC